MSARPAGVVVWSGRSRIDGSPIVAIITGLGKPSRNSKTGPMAQLWVLHAEMHPREAILTGADRSVCGGCMHRGGIDPATGRHGYKRTCYVRIDQAPAAIYKTYARGGYPAVSPAEAARLLAEAGRPIRLGAYGDPALVPVSILRRLVAAAGGGTGYTHQWRKKWAQPYAGLLMASADTLQDRQDARLAGWRSFYVRALTDTSPVTGAVECAAERETRPLTCAECRMCAGTRSGTVTGAVDIFITVHGAGARAFTPEPAAEHLTAA